MNILKIFCVCSFFVLQMGSAFAEGGRLQLQPEKPKPGDVVKISYTLNTKAFSAGDTLKCIACFMGEYTNQEAILRGINYKSAEVKLIKKGNLYQGEVTIDPQAKTLAFNFTAGKLKLSQTPEATILKQGKFDNNDSLGYVVPLYDKQGNVLPKTNYYAGFYLGWGARNLAFSNLKLARTYFLKEIETNPGEADALLIFLLSITYSISEAADFDAVAKKQMNNILQKDSLTEDDYDNVANYSYSIKLSGISGYFTKEMDRKFSSTSAMKQFEKAVEQYQQETDFDKKYRLLDNIDAKFNALPVNKKLLLAYSPNLPNATRLDLLNTILKKGTFEQYNEYAKKLNYKKEDILFFSNFLVQHFTTLIDSLKNYPLAESQGKVYLAYYTEQYDKVNAGKAPSYGVWDEFLTKDDKLDEIQQGIILLNWNLAKIYAKLNDNAKAFSHIAKAIQLIPTLREDFYFLPKINELYVSLAESQLPDNQLKPALENLIASGKWSQSMVDVLKKIYVKEKGSDAGFDAYIKNLKQSNINAIIKEVLAQQINEPAPAFSLTDLEGKTVTLADYKGKTVILDFWATWCGPCKASFPAMKKLQTSCKNNPDVVLLFVDTFERFKTTDENKVAVKDFMTKNDYPFHVLFDSSSKVSASFKVSSIPTKIVIDKNGNIRYKISGAELQEGKLIDEINAMIETINMIETIK